MNLIGSIRLVRETSGQLTLHLADGTQHKGITPVRAFAISAPDEGIALVNAEGHEVLWVESLDILPSDARQILEAEFSQRDFMPVIESIQWVESFATPSVWQVETDRGSTRLVLKSEDDIRRLPNNALLIADSQGVQFLIRDLQALDAHSRKILRRFL